MTHQYYPTGEHTAARMFGKFKRPVKYICDPSAGKGHLIRHAQAGFPNLREDQIPWLKDIEDETFPLGRARSFRLREYARKKFDHFSEITVVEIDIQHHADLKELGAKIIGFDFLDVQSLATVGSVIMNPPFNDGPKHVLHAWDVVYDAEIVAIINAESIKNPYTQERRHLVDLINKHGTVEFLRDQFVDDVERTTEVEVALIYLEKTPATYFDTDSLFGGLRKGDNLRGEVDTEVCTALALPSNFINDTYYRFEQAVEAARRCSEANATAEHLKVSLGITLEEMQAKGVGNDFRQAANSVREAANQDFLQRYDDLKSRAWAQIIRSSLLTDRISNQARKQLEAKSKEIYDLEFTIGNIHGFLKGVIDSMGDIYQNMVCDLFDTIIERSNDNVVFYRSWKSNSKHRIGVRIRKTRFIIPRFKCDSHGNFNFESQQFIADIDKVFGYLHGISGPYEGLVDGANKGEIRYADRISTRFFDFRFYWGAGTIHFYPKSEEVVEKINLFVGKLRRWIPGDMGEANQDFKKQYEKGESLSKDYFDHYVKATRDLTELDSPANAVIRAYKGAQALEQDAGQLNRIDNAIDAVHTTMGLHPGAALTASDKEAPPQLGYQAEEPQQLLLLDA